jgi:hypothetical protein
MILLERMVLLRSKTNPLSKTKWRGGEVTPHSAPTVGFPTPRI